jgi:hypothetical protein
LQLSVASRRVHSLGGLGARLNAETAIFRLLLTSSTAGAVLHFVTPLTGDFVRRSQGRLFIGFIARAMPKHPPHLLKEIMQQMAFIA